MSNRLRSQPKKPVPAAIGRRVAPLPASPNPSITRPATPRPPLRWILTAVGMVVALALLVSAYSVWAILHTR